MLLLYLFNNIRRLSVRASICIFVTETRNAIYKGRASSWNIHGLLTSLYYNTSLSVCELNMVAASNEGESPCIFATTLRVVYNYFTCKFDYHLTQPMCHNVSNFRQLCQQKLSHLILFYFNSTILFLAIWAQKYCPYISYDNWNKIYPSTQTRIFASFWQQRKRSTLA